MGCRRFFGLGGLWFCLSEDSEFQKQSGLGYTHTAFSVEAEKLMVIQKNAKLMVLKSGKKTVWKGTLFIFRTPMDTNLNCMLEVLKQDLNTTEISC